MVINLTLLGDIAAIIGCAFLLLLWLFISRRLRGFFYTCIGWALIVAAQRSDQKPATLAGIFILGAVLVAILTATHALMVSRRRAARSRGPVYIPTANRK